MQARHFIIALAGMLVWSIMGGVVNAQEIGEDGQVYVYQHNDRSDWRMGVIDPKLDTILALESPATLKVMVFYEHAPMAATVASVKQAYEQQVQPLSEQIKAIEAQYRPAWSLDPEEEKVMMQSMDAAITTADKMELNRLRQDIDGLMDAMRSDIAATMESAVAQNEAIVAAYVEQLGGEVTARVATVGMLGCRIPAGVLEALASHALVTSITYDPPVEYELDVSADTVGYSSWWNQGLTGGAYDFGIVDSGLQEDHPAFSGFTFYTNSGSSSDWSDSGHGTHVAGIVLSDDGTYRGGAYGLDAVIWSLAGDQSGTIDQMEWQASTPAQRPEVINHSLGYGIATDTDYSDSDAFYDAFVYNYNIQVSKSAGNEGWDDPLSLTHPGPAYNILVVANMDDQNTVSRDDDVRRVTSSIGPTVNDRRKPDITAPGVNIMSTNNSWSGTGSGNVDPSCWDTRAERSGYDWSRCSGTSQSAPHVSAGVILMEDGGNNSPIAQKAVLINTADAWDSNDTETTVDDGEVTGSHWDRSYGWGYLDMNEAYFNRGDYFYHSTLDVVVPRNDNNTDDDYKLYEGTMFTDEKATLTWWKRSNYVAGEPPSTKYGLSDLNIRLYDGDDGSLMDSDLQTNDNVHQVAADNSGSAVIKVYSWSTSFSGESSERYALATEENFSRVDPPAFTASLAAVDSTFYYEREFDMEVTVENTGGVAAHNVEVTLNPGAYTLISGANPQNIGTIAAGASEVATYRVKSPPPPDGFILYTMTADVSSYSYAETYTTTSPLTIFTPTSPYPLSNETPEDFTGVNAAYSFPVRSYDWVGLCLKPEPTYNVDLRADDNSDFSSPYQISTYFLEGAPDLVVTNGHNIGSATHYGQAYHFDGTTDNYPYTIETEEAWDITVNSYHDDDFTGNEVLEIYESNLGVMGATYRVEAQVLSGSLDVDLFGFKPSRNDGRRYDNDYQSIGAGVGGTESIEFVADETGDWGFALTNENGGTGTVRVSVTRVLYTLDVSTDPEIGALIQVSVGADDTTPFSRDYEPGTVVNLSAPSMHSGYSFIRWRLDGVNQPLYQTGLNVTMSDHRNAVAYYSAPAPECGDALHPYPPGDITQDCYVNLYDFDLFSGRWGDSCFSPTWCGGADLNEDGVVNFADLVIFVVNWLDCTDPNPPCSYLP